MSRLLKANHMQKKFIILLLTLTTAVCTLGQNAYYDALGIRNILDSNKHFGPNQFGVLAKYYPGQNANQIAAALATNPFLKNYFDPSSAASVEEGLAGRTLNRIGGINVTTIADGLAKFLVERVKEELSVAFFNQFKEDMQDERYSDLHILFPQTKMVLETIDEKIYQFSAYLTELRDAFIVDLENLPYNCPILIDQPKYDEFFAKRPIYKTLLRLGSITAELLLKKDAITHPGVIIDSVLKPDHYFNLARTSSSLDTNLNGSIKALQLISGSIRSLDTSRYWLPTDSLTLVLNDPIAFDLYLGMLYAKANADKIIFSGNRNFSAILAGMQTTLTTVRQSIFNISLYVRSIDQNFKRIKEIKAGISKDSLYRYYYALYTSTIDFLGNGLQLTKNWNSGINVAVEKYVNIFKDFGEVYVSVNQKKYGLAILSVIKLADNIFDSAYLVSKSKIGLHKVLTKLSLYGTFIAEVAKAETSDEVKEILDRTVLPTGSSFIKKHSRFNIALNAYTGLYYGQQRQSTDKQFVSVAGVYAPVGISASWGISGRKRESRSWSISLFASAIDIGPLVAYRFSNYNDTLANDVTIRLSQIVSPGGHLIIGLPKLPISIGGGFNWSPLITRVEKESLTTQPNDKRPFRWQVFAAVDIPLFNFYNKPR